MVPDRKESSAPLPSVLGPLQSIALNRSKSCALRSATFESRRDKGMKHLGVLTGIVCMGILAACSSSPEDQAAKAKERSYKAQEQAVQERLRLVEQYTKCVKNAASDAQKVELCDSYLQAAQALR